MPPPWPGTVSLVNAHFIIMRVGVVLAVLGDGFAIAIATVGDAIPHA